MTVAVEMSLERLVATLTYGGNISAIYVGIQSEIFTLNIASRTDGSLQRLQIRLCPYDVGR